MKTFKDKVALITGATSGIGRAAALAFGHEGARVVVAGRRDKDGQDTVALIRKEGGEATFVPTDVTREADVSALVGKTLTTYGRLDIAFNNAGVEEMPTPIHAKTVDNYHHVMDANVLGVLLSLKYEIPAMLKNGGGAIVNNASVAGVSGFPGLAVYVASKHAVLGLTKSAALEYATQRIRVNAVLPGAIETPMFDRFAAELGSDGLRHVVAMHPMGRTGKPGEIAAAVLWLCSDQASFVTGQSLGIDGGWTAK